MVGADFSDFRADSVSEISGLRLVLQNLVTAVARHEPVDQSAFQLVLVVHPAEVIGVDLVGRHVYVMKTLIINNNVAASSENGFEFDVAFRDGVNRKMRNNKSDVAQGFTVKYQIVDHQPHLLPS